MEHGAASALPALWFLPKPRAEVQDRWTLIPRAVGCQSPWDYYLVTAWLVTLPQQAGNSQSGLVMERMSCGTRV